MRKPRVLCVSTALLGNAVMTENIVRAINRVPGIEATFVILSVEDFSRYPAPWWARLTDPWHAQFIVRSKTAPERKQPFDILFVNGWESVIALRDLAHRMPAAAMMDVVPATIDRQLRQRGRDGWKRRLAHSVHHRAFRSAAADFNRFLPYGSDCAASLIEDYGVAPNRCSVTLPPKDLAEWTPAPKDFIAPWRLLFVGNDFERKGGLFLLELYSQYLAQSCQLTIVSNDSQLASIQLPSGVHWVRGATREQLRDLYRSSHLFLFPTRQDFAPQVLVEAAASGLPAIGTRLGGIPDLIQDGQTGFVMPRDSSAAQWAKNIHGLLADPGTLEAMSARTRQFAESELGLERFDRHIAAVIADLRELQ